MILLLLLTLPVSADDDVHLVEEGETLEVTGPAVWMSGARFRQYVSDSRNLLVCQESLDKAVTEGIEANDRALRARDIAMHEFEADEALISTQVQTIANLGSHLDQERLRNQRLRSQRNLALGVSVGFLSAATAAVVLSLD